MSESRNDILKRLTESNSDEEVEKERIVESDSTSLEKKLTQLTDNVKASESLAKILADPDIMQVLQMKQRGEEVEVRGKREPEPDVSLGFESENEVDFDLLSQTDLVKHLMKILPEAVGKIVDSKVKPLGESVGSIERFVQGSQRDLVQQQIKSAEEKFSDFEQYKLDMLETHKQNPGLSVEELYYVSKSRKTREGPERKIESEKPSSATSRPSAKEAREKPRSGISGFREILSEGIEKVVSGLDLPK